MLPATKAAIERRAMLGQYHTKVSSCLATISLEHDSVFESSKLSGQGFGL